MSRLDLPSAGDIVRERFVVLLVGDQRELGPSLEVTSQGSPLGRFTVVDKWSGPLARVPAYMLESAHDPLCRTFSGAVAFLKFSGYSDVQFESPVTTLVLERDEEDGGLVKSVGPEVARRVLNGRPR